MLGCFCSRPPLRHGSFCMVDLTLGPMRVQGAAATLAKAAEKLGVEAPAFIEYDGRGPPPILARKRRECHMRSLTPCQNEPHCSEAGECVLYLAVAARKGFVRDSTVDDARIERVREAIADVIYGHDFHKSGPHLREVAMEAAIAAIAAIDDPPASST